MVVLPGYKAAELYAEVGIPVTVILDSAVGYVMEKVSERLCRAGGDQWQVGSGKGKEEGEGLGQDLEREEVVWQDLGGYGSERKKKGMLVYTPSLRGAVGQARPQGVFGGSMAMQAW